VSEAIKLVRWLHDQDIALDRLRQDLVDEWIAAGTTTRRSVRLFLAWLERSDVTGRLHVPWNVARNGHGPLDDEQRFAVLRQLLHGDGIDQRDRLAGALLLLYAQPLTRTAALRTSDIRTTASGTVTIALARGAVELPDPIADIASGLRSARLAPGSEDAWLCKGINAGAGPEVEDRLARVEIRDGGRDAAPERRVDRAVGQLVTALLVIQPRPEHARRVRGTAPGRAAAARFRLELAGGIARGGGGLRIALADGLTNIGHVSHADSSSSASGITK
jgi:hypothetical protein